MVVALMLSGCAAKSPTAATTVFITQTASAESTTGDTATSGVTVAPLPSSTDTPSVGVSGASTSGSASETAPTSASTSMAPIVKVDPLKANCAKVLNNTELGAVFGQLPAGTARVVEGANPDRKITGRLKCQYGVADDKSTIAVSVVLAQFETVEAATAQISTTVQTESQAGAKASTTSIQGHPANVLLRDGGLLVFGYDTWTLSVVVDKDVLSDDKLPAGLAEIADYALSKVLSQGG
jgi:hypothetical protein